ncbi:MAG: anti-sigma factor family protein [Armatimonadota bacterium]
MATCKAVRQLMSAYIDRELPRPQAAEVRSHLAGCVECAEYHDDLQALDGLLDAAPSAGAHEGFAAEVLARVREREDESALTRLRRAVWRPMSGWAAAAAIALAIALGSGLAWVSAPDPAPPPRVADAGAVAETFGLDVFRPLAEDTVGGAYVQVAWPQDGEGR